MAAALYRLASWDTGVSPQLEAYVAKEEQLYARLIGPVKVDRYQPDELTWLMQRRYWAEIGEPPARLGWNPDAILRRRTVKFA